jgi:hypothetical protein
MIISKKKWLIIFSRVYIFYFLMNNWKDKKYKLLLYVFDILMHSFYFKIYQNNFFILYTLKKLKITLCFSKVKRFWNILINKHSYISDQYLKRGGYNASKLRRKKPEPKHYKFMMSAEKSDQDCSSFVQTDNRNQMYNIRRNIAYIHRKIANVLHCNILTTKKIAIKQWPVNERNINLAELH